MKIFLLSILIVGILSFGTSAFAAATSSAYTPLVELPGIISGEADMGAEDYVQSLYFLSITIGALIAVVKIIFGGVQYMLSDVITSKEKAKKDIFGALLGLLIILSAVLILNTVNPNLTKLNIFQNAPAIGKIEQWEAKEYKIGDTVNLDQRYWDSEGGATEEERTKIAEDFKKGCSKVGTVVKGQTWYGRNYLTCELNIGGSM